MAVKYKRAFLKLSGEALAKKDPATGEQKEMFETTCANCGGVAKVPFQPTSDRPVYCSECFASMKQN